MIEKPCGCYTHTMADGGLDQLVCAKHTAEQIAVFTRYTLNPAPSAELTDERIDELLEAGNRDASAAYMARRSGASGPSAEPPCEPCALTADYLVRTNKRAERLEAALRAALKRFEWLSDNWHNIDVMRSWDPVSVVEAGKMAIDEALKPARMVESTDLYRPKTPDYEGVWRVTGRDGPWVTIRRADTGGGLVDMLAKSFAERFEPISAAESKP